jgi:hypothetical protein
VDKRVLSRKDAPRRASRGACLRKAGAKKLLKRNYFRRRQEIVSDENIQLFRIEIQNSQYFFGIDSEKVGFS